MVELLYVEDDEDLRWLCTEILTDEGHIVHPAADGLEGLDVLRQVEGIQIIFTDGNMPRMSGSQFTYKVKSDPDYARYAATPIIGTGAFSDSSMSRLVELLKKPFESSELLRCIQQY